MAAMVGPTTVRPSELRGTLTAWLIEPGAPPARAAVDAAVDSFRAEHPDLTVDVEYVPRAEAQTRLTAAVAAAEAPDLSTSRACWRRARSPTSATATRGTRERRP
jgi:ABC-type glycerol-3-phosphate transport system substrate-binding protein